VAIGSNILDFEKNDKKNRKEKGPRISFAFLCCHFPPSFALTFFQKPLEKMEISPEEQHEDDMETNAAVSLPSHVSEPSDSMEMGLEIQPLLSPSQHQDPIVYTSAQGFVFEDPDKNEKDAFLESLLEKPEEPVIQQTVQAASVAIAEELVGVAKDGPREQLLTRFLHHDPSTGKPTMGKWREVDGILHGLPRKVHRITLFFVVCES
jgi:hypothetical protein